MTAFKAQGHMRSLKEKLSMEISALAVTDSQDADANPIAKFVASGETVFVKIETVDNAGRVDGLGLAQRAYSPHKATILQDLDTITSREVRYKILAACAMMGTRVQVYEIAVLPSSYDLTGATLTADMYPDPLNKLTNQQ